MKWLRIIVATTESRFLIILLSLFSLLRLPSLFEPLWYGDEGIYQVIGRAIRSGRILYSGIWDNKPPLLYLTYALVNSDQFLVRLLSYIAGILAVFGLYMLTKKLFMTPKVRYPVTILFALLFALPATEANIANAENFMLVFLIFAGLLVFSFSEDSAPAKTKKILLAGLLLGIAFLYKIVALLDFTAFFLFLLFVTLPKSKIFTRGTLKQTARTLLPFFVGFILPIALTILYFLVVGSFTSFLSASFTNNVSYVGYKNYFFIPQGLLITKLILLFAFICFLFWKKSRFSRTSLFILLWFAFSFFNVYFSQRAYTHYLLVGITAFSLLFGLTLAEKKHRILSLSLLLGALIMTFSLFNLMSPKHIVAYYQNFLSYILDTKTTGAYQTFFDSDVPNDYAIAEFIKPRTKSGETMFLWGNSAQIYTLSDTLPPGRYTVAYHINSKNAILETQEAIETQKPKFIIIQSGAPVHQFILTAYIYRATIGAAAIYERTF